MIYITYLDPKILYLTIQKLTTLVILSTHCLESISIKIECLLHYVLIIHLKTIYHAGEKTEEHESDQDSNLTFIVGETVKVNVDVEVLKKMQEGHGGWNPRMSQVGHFIVFENNQINRILISS